MGAAAGVAQAGIGVAQMIQAKKAAEMQEIQAEFQAKQQEFNADLISMRREDIEAIGQDNVDQRNMELRQILGGQKAAMAAQGIEIDGELSSDLEKTERFYANQDIRAIKNNTWRESMGLKIEESSMRQNARQTRAGGAAQAHQTFVTGGLQGLGSMVKGYGQYEEAKRLGR